MWVLAIMTFLLQLAAAVTTYTPTQYPATIWKPWPVVFGFEFTMTGIVTSAGLPNGTNVPVGFTPGSAAYRAEMSRLYSICEEVARTGILPPTAQEWRSAGAPWRWSSGFPSRWVGESVDALGEAVTAAKNASVAILSEKYGVTYINPRATLHALAVAPNFIFTTMKPITARHPLALWMFRTHEPEAFPDMATQMVAKAWLNVMVTRFSEAVVQAGFHRCSIPWLNDPRDQNPSYDLYEFVYPAATHAICTAEVGKCFLKYEGTDLFHEHGITPCSYPGSVAVVADLQETGLSLWAEGINDCQLDSVRWNTWPELKPPPTDKTGVWSESVRQKILGLLKATASKSNTEDGVVFIPTGNSWNSELLDTLRNLSTMKIHEVSQPQFAASTNAVKIARFEERTIAEHRWTHLEGWKPPVESYFDPMALWWCFEDKLWTVGGGCLNDQECEHACKWRGEPVCHPKDQVCMCGELWEDTPGGKREELYRKLWEAGPAVLKKLSTRTEFKWQGRTPVSGSWDQAEFERREAYGKGGKAERATMGV
ncbi:uncharacterized protein RCC_04093 [Ramularia collo-cygni]|uniref:Uncharacterized protein n=1 Tax=Ramularia collo-cygni TaxID=112498 RepID=A0A2D3UTF2_9PEZI|nr:uncharacterized protein RCC_04093 [Ramularia collo-cygni]CZT18248.1 uncharacterized protein RCC_04093 [Ramularia collo-cygni]